MEEHTFNDGTCENLLCLDGTIPVIYRQTTYNIPINIYVLKGFPYTAPMVYVRPTFNMSIKTNRYVDDNGKIKLPYLDSWKHPDSDLIGLIRVLIDVFGEQPPVYSRPQNQPAMPSFPAAGMMRKFSLTYDHLPFEIKAPLPNMGMPGPQPSSVGSFWTSGGQSYNMMPGPGYPPPPLPPSYAPVQSGWNKPNIPAPYPTTIMNSVPTNNSITKPSNNTGMIDAEFLEISERSALADKVRRVHHEYHSQYQSELQSLIATQHDLQKGTARIAQIISDIDSEHRNLERAEQQLSNKNKELEEVLQKLEETKDEAVNIDEIVTPSAPLFRQLLASFAEEQAIDDALYSLGQALGKNVIDLDTFLKRSFASAICIARDCEEMPSEGIPAGELSAN
ncbi:hypothetical protein Ciccas_003858 [Cichlidogyrus casuarinus]|uniref:UEV domain-containing protein n=1 Tax=Cichlidogyrus casuarinus TaxID=1844966 RepID=A0ABD2QD75_9PLAT